MTPNSNRLRAPTPPGRIHFMVFTESFTAEVMCRFLERIAGHFDHKVHLVVDGHSAHRSRKVRDWLAAHPDDAKLRFRTAREIDDRLKCLDR
ncbi:transposase [Streptomyces sp. MUM 178J]|uniref:transposase n=1 Tax=Streptomyces sp. MUM 178J TaxID=2791991 RepID=UPI003FA6E09E